MDARLLLCWFLVSFIYESRAALLCGIRYGANQMTFNISDVAANSITMNPGKSVYNMQVFECTCPSNYEYFDDTDVTSVDRDFYKADQYDWTQSQIFRIYNCSSLQLSLKSGKNTFSNLLKGKLLLIEGISQLVITDFQVGVPTTLNADDTFSSIYFRNVTIYQVPQYFEFDDRFEVLFTHVNTNEGSSKVEPFDIRIKNTNYSRNPVFRMEYCSFGGINIITDGYTLNIFSLTVQNLQRYNNTACYYDYQGSVRLIGNTFGYLRARNIYITNGMEFVFEDNFVDTLNTDAFDLTNLKTTRLRNNIFGYILLDPLINMFFYKGGGSSCSTQDLPESSVTTLDFSGNRVQRLESNLFLVSTDPGYSSGFINKANVANIAVNKPCNCTDPQYGNSPTDSQRLALNAIRQSRCLSYQRVMGNRTDICNGILPLSEKQELDKIARETRNNWIIYLIIATIVTAIIVAILTAVICKCCCKGCCN